MWIKKRLKEAKGAGLIRVAKVSGAAPSLATATVAPSRSRPSDAPRSPEPVPTSFEATPSASPAPAPVSPARAVSAASPSRSRKPREHALPPTPEPAVARRFASAKRNPRRDVAPNTHVSFTPPASPEFSPSVFVPASATKARRAPRESRASTRSAAVRASVGDVEPATAWFARRREAPSAPLGFWDDGARGATSSVPPGAPPAVADAARAKDATMARTVGETGSRARRMAEAAALAQRDLAARETNGYGAAEVAAGRLDARVSARGGGNLSAAARGHARLLQLQAERKAGLGSCGVEGAARELSGSREKALAAKKRRFADANAQLRAALERARLGVPPQLRAAARDGTRAFRETTRSSASGMIAPGARLDARESEPATLREAAMRFIDIAGASPTETKPSSKRDRAALPQSGNKHAKPRGRCGPPDDFLERMRLREEQKRARREARASEWRLMAAETTGKPGWDDSPDVVVRVGASPEETRRREREREAERALLVARREALLEQMRAQSTPPGRPRSPTTGVEAVARGAGFAKARRSRPGAKAIPSPRTTGARFPGSGGGSQRKNLSPAAERQREADARRAAGLEPKYTRVAFGKPFSAKQKKSPKAERAGAGRSPSASAREVSPKSERATDEALRRTATRMLDSPEGRASLRASGFDLDGSLRRSAAAQTGASLVASASPLASPALFATRSPARRMVESAGGDPRREIDAMRVILDEVVAHLRTLHEAAEGVAGPETRVGEKRRDAADSAVDAFAPGASVASSGPYALDAADRNRALDMLRAVEARELAMRQKWGLRGADGDEGALAASPTRETLPSRAEVVARARASIREIEADTAHVSRRISADARSLRGAGAAALESAVDADAVARVWEARSRYLAWRAAADDAISAPDGEDDAFDPSEVNEEVAERLLDGLLTGVAVELAGACDDATAAVLRQEFTSSAEREPEGDGSVGVGGVDSGSNPTDDDFVGPAIERACFSGRGLKSDE